MCKFYGLPLELFLILNIIYYYDTSKNYESLAITIKKRRIIFVDRRNKKTPCLFLVHYNNIFIHNLHFQINNII